jgi:hypothetical protein
MLLLLIRKMRHAFGVVAKTYAIARAVDKSASVMAVDTTVIARPSRNAVCAREVL